MRRPSSAPGKRLGKSSPSSCDNARARRRRGNVATMRTTSEYELKLVPPLGGSVLAPRLVTSVYYDVPGGSLVASGITMRRRIEDGRSVWQLKLPSDDSRLELEAAGG